MGRRSCAHSSAGAPKAAGRRSARDGALALDTRAVSGQTRLTDPLILGRRRHPSRPVLPGPWRRKVDAAIPAIGPPAPATAAHAGRHRRYDPRPGLLRSGAPLRPLPRALAPPARERWLRTGSMSSTLGDQGASRFSRTVRVIHSQHPAGLTRLTRRVTWPS